MKNTRALVFGLILLVALAAFELFNFATTRYAVWSLVGDEVFLGLSWATVLALAFCGIDFAGLGRLFTPEKGRDEPTEVWYLLGAWFLGATLNAVATWWAVTLRLTAGAPSAPGIPASDVRVYAPVLVAAGVWLIRVLLIGTFSLYGDHMLNFTGLFNAHPKVPGDGYAPGPIGRLVDSLNRGSERVSAYPVPSDGTRSVSQRALDLGDGPGTDELFAGIHAQGRDPAGEIEPLLAALSGNQLWPHRPSRGR